MIKIAEYFFWKQKQQQQQKTNSKQIIHQGERVSWLDLFFAHHL